MNAFRTRLAVSSLLLPLCLGTTCLGSRAQTGDREISLEVGGRTRTCLIHLPPTYAGDRPAPLVLVLHGGGGNAAQAARSYGMNSIADREGFIVAYPNGTSAGPDLLTWNAATCCGYANTNGVDDVAFIRALIDELSRVYKVDAKRIYATGMSNGAMMAYRLGCQLSDKIAAIAPVAGALNDTSCAPPVPLSVIIFHGTGDLHVLYNGGVGSEQMAPRHDNSVASAVSFWTDRDACDLVPTTVTSESGNVVTDTYSGGKGGSEVVLVTIRGGGHAWPGGAASPLPGADPPTQEISASELMWEFFKRHPKSSGPTTVRVTGPNGGEVIRRGQTLTVTWEVENGQEVTGLDIQLSGDDGNTYVTVASALAPETRTMSWTVPESLPRGTRYRARVVANASSGPVASDESDAVFRIKKHAH